jgi:tetratricopeptide (TPR) repeat protein
MNNTLRTSFCLALTAIVVLLIAPLSPVSAQQEADLPDLKLVPHPDLSKIDPEVSRRLQPAVDFFRDQRMSLEGGQLGLAYGRMGINYLANGQQAAAGACFYNAMALDTTNPRWPYLLGIHYEQTGDPEAAAASFGHALDLAFSFTPALIHRSQMQLLLNQPEEAETGFFVAVRRNPEDPAALAGLGQALFLQGKYAEALDALQKALDLDPEANSIHGQLAAVYRAMGEDSKAASEQAKAGDRKPRIDDPLMTFVRSHAGDFDRYMAAAALARENNSPDAAIQGYELAASIQPGNIEALMKLGEMNAATGRLDAAMVAFSRLLAIEPDNAKANYFVGMLFEQTGNDAEAEVAYRKALEAEPQLVEPRLLLANSLMRRKAFSEAGENYGQIAHVLPKNAEVTYLLGMAWLASGDCQWAHPVLARGLKLSPGDEQMVVAATRAFAICDDSTDEQKIQALETATALYLKDPSMRNAETLAMASAANGKFTAAVDFQAQAIFEALKTDKDAGLEWLQANMALYQENKMAQQAWSPDAEVFKPRRVQGPPPVLTPTAGEARPADQAGQ